MGCKRTFATLLTFFLKTFFASIEFQKNNGPVLLFKTIFRHSKWFLSSVAKDGEDELGLKLEKIGPLSMPAKTTTKLL